MYFAKFEFDEPSTSDLGRLLIEKGLFSANSLGSVVSNTATALTSAATGGELGSFSIGKRIKINLLPRWRTGEEKAQFMNVIVEIPIVEEFTFETKSNFQDLGSITSNIPVLGTLQGIFKTLEGFSAAGGGKVADVAGKLKLQVWESTEPFRMAFKGVLDNQTSPYNDVYLPARIFSSMNILTYDNLTRKFYVPGYNRTVKRKSTAENEAKRAELQASEEARRAKAALRGTTLTTKQAKTRLQAEVNKGSNKIIGNFSIYSKNSLGEDTVLLDVGPAFLETAKPTWSREQTESGYPIWCEMELNIQSIYSATDALFPVSSGSSSFLASLGRGALKQLSSSTASSFR